MVSSSRYLIEIETDTGSKEKAKGGRMVVFVPNNKKVALAKAKTKAERTEFGIEAEKPRNRRLSIDTKATKAPKAGKNDPPLSLPLQAQFGQSQAELLRRREPEHAQTEFGIEAEKPRNRRLSIDTKATKAPKAYSLFE